MSLTPLHLNPRTLSVPRASDGRWYSDGRTEVSPSGGTAALSWSAPDGFEVGKKLIIETDGTHDFGADAPEFLVLMDAANGTPGEDIDPSEEYRLGAGVTVEGGSGLKVSTSVHAQDMPRGSSFDLANHTDTLSSKSYRNTRFSCNPHTVGFESRVLYMPDAHAQNIYDLRFGNEPLPEGDEDYDWVAWGAKAMQNMADRQFGPADTDFYVNSIVGTRAGQEGRFISSGSIGSNNSAISGQSFLGSTTQRTIGPEEYRVPLDEPHIEEFAWDQGDVSTTGTARARLQVTGVESGVFQQSAINDTTLHEPDGDTKIINTFNCLGYIEGFHEPLGCHFLVQSWYKQVGWSRVAICDSPDYFDAKHKQFLIPISWAPTKIEYEIVDGWWAPDQWAGKHICIVGPDNEQITSVEIN